tara:strand:- start:2283 stop:2654 length:372 start_codon:yes stop_codon:yes gene_type:complete
MKLDLDKVPSTVEAAVDAVTSALEPEEIDYIRRSDKPSLLHQSIGMYLRNEWSLWDDDSPLKRDAVEKFGIGHADDISGLILEWAHARVKRNDDFDPRKHCQKYIDHWKRLGVNPATGKLEDA